MSFIHSRLRIGFLCLLATGCDGSASKDAAEGVPDVNATPDAGQVCALAAPQGSSVWRKIFETRNASLTEPGNVALLRAVSIVPPQGVKSFADALLLSTEEASCAEELLLEEVAIGVEDLGGLNVHLLGPAEFAGAYWGTFEPELSAGTTVSAVYAIAPPVVFLDGRLLTFFFDMGDHVGGAKSTNLLTMLPASPGEYSFGRHMFSCCIFDD